jgi:DNA-directed RNA polymerase specialized sigma24 family protein
LSGLVAITGIAGIINQTMNKGGQAHFPKTNWTLISRLRSPDGDEAQAALEELCATYHYPLYCYIRRRGLNHHDAQDALQEFLIKLLRNHSLQAAHEDEGHLRGFLAMALCRFLSNWHRDHAKERLMVSIEAEAELARDEKRYQKEKLTEDDTPDRLFERKWAQEMLRRVLAEMETDYQRKDKHLLFRTLRPIVLAGGSLVGEATGDIASSLNMSPAALRVALSRFLGDYRDRLRREVLQTIANPDEIDDELACLARAFERRSSGCP